MQPLARRYRAELEEQKLEYAFDRLRYKVDRCTSQPLRRARFDQLDLEEVAAAQKCAAASVHDKLELVSLCLDDVEAARLRSYGVTFADPDRLFRAQCEMRTLVARCLSVQEMFDEALRELRLAVSGLSTSSPPARFLIGIVQAHTAEIYLLRSNFHLRRREKSGLLEDRQKYRQSLSHRRRSAIKDLDLASASLDAADAMIRGIRWNVSRWEGLHELRAQLMIERLLLRGTDLDFEIDLPADDWRFIGGLQSDIATGLEAIRAALDCTIYPHQVDVDGAGLEDKGHKRILETHGRLVGLWMQLMLASFWVLRLFSLKPGPHSPAVSLRGQSPRLQALRMFNLHGSRTSFWDRWEPLNRAAGLDRFVESLPKGKGESPIEVAKLVLEDVIKIEKYFIENNRDRKGQNEKEIHPPCTIREFMVLTMRAIYESGASSGRYVDRFQKALRKVSEAAEHE